MTSFTNNGSNQRGVALVTVLLFLVVVSFIAVTSAQNSALGMKMSGSMQDSYVSFEAAEAGAYAALGLAGSAQDPFKRQDLIEDPFADLEVHPLRNQAEDDGVVPVDVDVLLLSTQRACPRPLEGRGGSSVAVFDCDYYRVESEHDVPGRARTHVKLGVVKTVIGST
jgi:type IV pilus assembly protein PilX